MVNSFQVLLFWLFLKAVSPVSGGIQKKTISLMNANSSRHKLVFHRHIKVGLLGIWLASLSKDCPNENSVMCSLLEFRKGESNSSVQNAKQNLASGIWPVFPEEISKHPIMTGKESRCGKLFCCLS